jgi:hypothetical protein
MSKLKITQAIAALLVFGVAVLPGTSCRETYIYGDCEEDAHCWTEWNYSGKGSMCLVGHCVCGVAGHVACCPDRREKCGLMETVCMPPTECAEAVASTTEGNPPDASTPPSDCTSDAGCPGPPDARCGVGRCRDGVCELDIWAGEKIENQFPGDCRVTVCSFDGDRVDLVDPSDVPYDNNSCTYDLCDGEKPVNNPLPDKSPCPGEDSGICVLGQCEECSEVLGVLTCKSGFQCVEISCVPMTCQDSLQSWPETGTDCGGPECLPCDEGYPCNKDRDCLSNLCDDAGLCTKSTHTDGVKNDSETGIDCGYWDGPPHLCKDWEGCGSSMDCMSAVCYFGECQAPTCVDATENGDETGVDCGGSCPACAM